jgi:hypothetical protein
MNKTNNDDTGLFSGIIPEGAKDTPPELQAALDRIFPDVVAAEEECVHDWKTTRSYGATVGYDAVCTKCGEETTFTPSDD